jgi:hypothetical protein
MQKRQHPGSLRMRPARRLRSQLRISEADGADLTQFPHRTDDSS